MVSTHSVRTDNSAKSRRQSEIAARLSALGLTKGLRILRAGDAVSSAETFERRLRTAFEALGTTFSAFGLYLSSRVDLLPAEICLELSAIADESAPTPYPAVWERFLTDTGRQPNEAFLYFAEEPFESRLLSQKHKARLPDGTQVTVKTIKPESEACFAQDEEFLILLAPVLKGLLSEHAFARAVEDFRQTLRRQFDLKHQALGFALLTADSKRLSMLRVPQIYKDLSGEKVITVEHLSGTRLADFPAAENTGRPSFERDELARLLYTAWLQQTLYGQVFPVVSDAGDIVVSEDKRIAFTDGLFVILPPETQENLRRYLSAAVSEQSELAVDFWLRELVGDERSEEKRLRQQLRQIVVFRDSDWFRGGRRGRILNLLVTQWRLAAGCGFTPRAELPSFYRGLFSLGSLSDRLAPDGDSLVEGLEDARLLGNLEYFREMASVEYLGANADKYAALFFELPRRFDELLQAEKNEPQTRPPHRSGPAQRKRSTARVTALMLLMAGVALIAPQLSALSEESAWVKRLSVVVFALGGVWLLRVTGRGG